MSGKPLRSSAMHRSQLLLVGSPHHLGQQRQSNLCSLSLIDPPPAAQQTEDLPGELDGGRSQAVHGMRHKLQAKHGQGSLHALDVT